GPVNRQSPALFAQRLRGELYDWMDALINTDYCLGEDILRPAFYRQVWREHLNGKDYHRLLGAIAPILELSRLLQRVRTKSLPSTQAPVIVEN
ncbi:MAG: hypothetical protein U9Q79_09280, partial [Candidatus Hydrogenedentes bacterium]|nr:hypothetical protein [Candidatus Hydrogenedentota bacterium]